MTTRIKPPADQPRARYDLELLSDFEEAFSDGVSPGGRYFVAIGTPNEHEHFAGVECARCLLEVKTK